MDLSDALDNLHRLLQRFERWRPETIRYFSVPKWGMSRDDEVSILDVTKEPLSGAALAGLEGTLGFKYPQSVREVFLKYGTVYLEYLWSPRPAVLRDELLRLTSQEWVSGGIGVCPGSVTAFRVWEDWVADAPADIRERVIAASHSSVRVFNASCGVRCFLALHMTKDDGPHVVFEGEAYAEPGLDGQLTWNAPIVDGGSLDSFLAAWARVGFTHSPWVFFDRTASGMTLNEEKAAKWESLLRLADEIYSTG